MSALTLTGVVLSTKMNKTVTVQVERKFRHAKYGKVITKHKKYHVHNEVEGIQEGDTVSIRSVKPVSKTVFFQVVAKVNTHKS